VTGLKVCGTAWGRFPGLPAQPTPGPICRP